MSFPRNQWRLLVLQAGVAHFRLTAEKRNTINVFLLIVYENRLYGQGNDTWWATVWLSVSPYTGLCFNIAVNQMGGGGPSSRQFVQSSCSSPTSWPARCANDSQTTWASPFCIYPMKLQPENLVHITASTDVNAASFCGNEGEEEHCVRQSMIIR